MTRLLLALAFWAALSGAGQARVVVTNKPSAAAPAGVYTVGVGGTYADINAAVTAICAGAGSAVTGTCGSGATQTKNITFQITSGGITTATTQTVSGWTAGTFTNTITFDSSGGFRAYLNARPSSPLYFNTTYGSFINLTTSGITPLSINVDHVNIFGVQISNTVCDGGTRVTGNAVVFGTNSNDVTVDSDIITWCGYADTYPGIFTSSTSLSLLLKNTLIVGVNHYDSMMVQVNGQITSLYNTLAMTTPPSVNQGAGIFMVGTTGTWTNIIENTAVLGVGVCNGGSGGENNAYEFSATNSTAPFIGTNNVSCLTQATTPVAWRYSGGFDGQVGAVLATEFVNAGPSSPDFHLASTSVKMRATGAYGAGGVTTDILGNPRNHFTVSPFTEYGDDVGVIAFSGGTAYPVLAGATTHTLTSGSSWTVTPDCGGTLNYIVQLIGAGGAGANGQQPAATGSSGGEFVQGIGTILGMMTTGSTISMSIPPPTTSGSGAATTFGSLKAYGGTVAVTTSSFGPAGGDNGSGTILRKGGDGGGVGGIYSAGGSGGAGGPLGDGAAGGRNTDDGNSIGGGGGGGADGGAPGSTGHANSGGAGGAGGASSGTSGGAGQAGCYAGGAGRANGGGGGGAGGEYSCGMLANAGAGGSDTQLADGVSGSGGGAGGSGVTYAANPVGAAGGLYGGGGGSVGGGTGGGGCWWTRRYRSSLQGSRRSLGLPPQHSKRLKCTPKRFKHCPYDMQLSYISLASFL